MSGATAATRGYSLIELALSMVIAGIVAAAAISTFSVVNSQIIQLRTEAAVEAKLQRTLAGLVADLQEVGGGALRPWHAMFVYPGDADMFFSDALLGVTVDSESGSSTPCPIISYNGTIVEVGEVLDFLQPAPPAPPATHCCLMDNTYTGRFAALARDQDAVIVGVNAATLDLATCTVGASVLFAPQRMDSAHSWELGQMAIVDAKWIALDHEKHTLDAYLLEYLAPAPALPGEVPPGMPIPIQSETRTLARDVYDFQIANGYDVDLDGIVGEVSGGADEWLGNVPGEVASETWLGDESSETGAAGFVSTRFRMVEIGLVVGLPSKIRKPREVSGVLDGPGFPSGTPCPTDHTNLFLRTGTARVLLRNSGLYE